MNGFESEPQRDFVPFDTYSFGIAEAGPGGFLARTTIGDSSRHSPDPHPAASLLPDLQSEDLSEALRAGASDSELQSLMGLLSAPPPSPSRVQTLQLPELAPMATDPGYSFEPVFSEEWAESPPDHQQASVDVQRNGDRVEKISIRCGCGEVIHLDCVY